MTKGLIGCAVLALAVILIAGLMVGGIYNRLVGLNEGVDSAWAQVENVYQRRADLIPNLVATVKGPLRSSRRRCRTSSKHGPRWAR